MNWSTFLIGLLQNPSAFTALTEDITALLSSVEALVTNHPVFTQLATTTVTPPSTTETVTEPTQPETEVPVTVEATPIEPTTPAA